MIFHYREMFTSSARPAMSILYEFNFIPTVQDEGASLVTFQVFNRMISHAAIVLESRNTRRHFSQNALIGRIYEDVCYAFV